MFKKEEILKDFKTLLAGLTINNKAVPVISLTSLEIHLHPGLTFS